MSERAFGRIPSFRVWLRSLLKESNTPQVSVNWISLACVTTRVLENSWFLIVGGPDRAVSLRCRAPYSGRLAEA